MKTEKKIPERSRPVLGRFYCITYSDYVFVFLFIQYAMRMRRIAICAMPALPYFSTLSNKRHDFRKKIIKHKILF